MFGCIGDERALETKRCFDELFPFLGSSLEGIRNLKHLHTLFESEKRKSKLLNLNLLHYTARKYSQ